MSEVPLYSTVWSPPGREVGARENRRSLSNIISTSTTVRLGPIPSRVCGNWETQPLLTRTQQPPAHPRACNTHHQTVSHRAPLPHSPRKHTRDSCCSRCFQPLLLSPLSQGAQFGHSGCHGLDELLISELWVENREVPADTRQHSLDDLEISWGHGSLCCLVLAHRGE
jgi:hypothetical protein